MLNGQKQVKVLVTGASGFLGRHLLPKLGQAGADVTALCRSSAASLPPDVRKIAGDCGDLSAMRRAVAGQDLVIHMASLLFATDWREYLSANVAYAENLARAVQEENPECRVVLVSSLAASGPSAEAPGRKESDPAQPVSGYGWSKLMAERTLAAALGERLSIIRPPIIYGSGDRGLLPLFKSCARGIGVSPGWRRFPVSLIHADDAADAILLAAGLPGLWHLSDGEVYSMDAVCQAMALAQGRKGCFVAQSPLALMAFTASVSELAYGLGRKMGKFAGREPGRPPAWNRDKYRESSQPGWLADGSLIRRELGFSAKYDLAAGMAEAVAGYEKEGLL